MDRHFQKILLIPCIIDNCFFFSGGWFFFSFRDADAEKDGLARGCAFCGGLEHRITNCPKLMKDQRKLNPRNKDAMRTDDGDW